MKPFPKEENKILAQTYFEYSKETSTAVASLSWKMNGETTLFQTERVYDQFWPALQPLPILPSSPPALAIAKWLFTHSFLIHSSPPQQALLLWSCPSLRYGQECSSPASNPALLWQSGLLCFLTSPPGFFFFQILCLFSSSIQYFPPPLTPWGSSCLSEYIFFIVISSHTCCLTVISIT